MNEKDLITLMHDVKRHEDAVMEDAKEIRGLKVDVWELSNLVRLLAAFVPRSVSGMVEEKAAIEFETQLQAVLQKHGIENWALSSAGKRYVSRRAFLLFYANDPKEDEIPLGLWCDLLEKELKTALDDLAKIRKASRRAKKAISA
jgi:hypothetical protein